MVTKIILVKTLNKNKVKVRRFKFQGMAEIISRRIANCQFSLVKTSY